MQGHSNGVILLYGCCIDGKPTRNMVRCQSAQYNSLFVCEGCRTGVNLLPVLGGVQSMCSVMTAVSIWISDFDRDR
jgi:hypothetical protein